MVCLFLMGFSAPSWSHVRWFVSPDDPLPSVSFDTNYISVLIALGVLAYGGFCGFLQRHHYRVDWLKFWWVAPIPLGEFKWKLLRAGISVLLVGNIALEVFIAPNLTLLSMSTQWILLVQSALLISLILGDMFFAMALMLVLLGITVMFPFAIWIDYVFEFMALVLAFLLLGISQWLERDNVANRRGLTVESTDQMAVSVIRLGLGLQLMVLAIHNKLMDPAMALMFVENHAYLNFMQLLGLTAFTHLHFVLAGGLAELCFGLLLALNVSSRFVAITVSFFFLASSLILGMHELVGHVPILACLLVIVISPETNSMVLVKRIWKEVWSMKRFTKMVGQMKRS